VKSVVCAKGLAAPIFAARSTFWGSQVTDLSTKTVAVAGVAAAAAAVAATGSMIGPLAPQSAAAPTAAEAARLLTQATWGVTDADITSVQNLGIEGWIDGQLAQPAYSTEAYLNQRRTSGPGRLEPRNHFQEAFFTRVANGPDQLRQRMQFALSEIFVISRNVELIEYNGMFGTAYYYDLLAKNAFGSFRTLLEDVTHAPMMGVYLSHISNQKEDLVSGRHPDENYAREIMQLFTIGPVMLNPDGSERLGPDGRTIPSYTHDDIAGLAKVFTGLALEGGSFFSGPTASYPKRMVYYPEYHSTSAKTFLGVTIPASTTPNVAGDIRIALDTLFNHPNVGPFIGRRLIQRFVTSNPSPAYISRVAAAFANNGAGVRGDLGAVIKAVLLDPEARDVAAATSNPNFGKLREPIIRLCNWIRTFKARSAVGVFEIHSHGNQITMGTGLPLQLGQAPLYAPSVFNFWRPGYSPPNTRMGDQQLVAPEFQAVNELSTAAYVNYIRAVINGGVGFNPSTYAVGDVKSTYADEIAIAADANALIDRMNTLLFYGQMSSGLRQQILSAVNAVTLPAGTGSNLATAKLNRAKLAVFLSMVSGEYITQR
jgi:uncharacterized protein (DUF1800 family)